VLVREEEEEEKEDGGGTWCAMCDVWTLSIHHSNPSTKITLVKMASKGSQPTTPYFLQGKEERRG